MVETRSFTIRSLCAALVIWGVFIAVGVCRFSQQRGHSLATSILMSSIVVLVVGLFFVLWGLTLSVQRRRELAAGDVESIDRKQPNNWSCIIALILAMLSSAVSLNVRFDELANVGVMGKSLFWTSSVGIGTSLLLAIVGLSNRQIQHAKWAGLATLVVVAMTVICWLIGGVSLPEPNSTFR